jgi:GNAT superfamily N-acetyltransferase
LPPGYIIQDGYPPVPEYLNLCLLSGFSPKTTAQATEASRGSWYGCFITSEEDNSLVGMGRIIGDGGWYFHIVDMAINPQHQRKGLGDHILKRLLWEISERAPKDGTPYITLMADGPGRKLYQNNGFVETAPDSLGMVLKRPSGGKE